MASNQSPAQSVRRVHLVNPHTGGLLEIDGWPEGGIEQ
jgi:hypothetical protein